jgi:putative PIN family toxin of toxin-antitoxin system
MRLVLDTDVIVAAFRSPTGASAALIELALDSRIELLVTVPLALEYEAVLKREEHLVATGMAIDLMDRRVRSLIAICNPVYRAFRWRPQLRDPADEMVLEAAVNGGADMLATFNQRDFGTAPAAFGIECLLPRDALEKARLRIRS